jgi:hypothetical protein
MRFLVLFCIFVPGLALAVDRPGDDFSAAGAPARAGLATGLEHHKPPIRWAVRPDEGFPPRTVRLVIPSDL